MNRLHARSQRIADGRQKPWNKKWRQKQAYKNAYTPGGWWRRSSPNADTIHLPLNEVNLNDRTAKRLRIGADKGIMLAGSQLILSHSRRS